VHVTINGEDWVYAGMFDYMVAAEVLAVQPTWGPAGTPVHVFVQGFDDDSEDENAAPLRCHFGPRWVAATVLIPGRMLRCIAPAANSTSESSFVASYGLRVNIEVSGGNVSTTASGHGFEYVQEPIVSSMQPIHGPLYGGTRVTAMGMHFENAPDLHCRFGDVMSAATFVSNTLVECETPPVSASLLSNDDASELQVPFHVAITVP
jgi:hypothetical protein